ncbi:MAG: hypothetical protein IJT62_01840 [Oscillospiraceae bacterium]|nr:hypothetical protein [Oscillospiraceae bacterium]
MEIDYKILPQDYTVNKDITDALGKTAVIIHLYYDDLFEDNLKYLRNIPGEIDAYIVTANRKLASMAREIIRQECRTNFRVISKPNRGRDYGALLVTCAEILPKYSYVCFVHDKKSRPEDDPVLGQTWQTCLFECTLASGDYIRNVVNAFEEDPRLGFLSSPMSPESTLLSVDGALWTANYLACASFLKKLGVQKIPPVSEEPLYVGSAFWLRTAAIQKLLAFSFSYEDFPAEPMPEDGTIAHVLERAIGFVAEDAGYSTAFVMSVPYSRYFLTQKTKHLTKAMQVLRAAKMIAYTDNRVDFDRMLAITRKETGLSDLTLFAVRYMRVFILSESGCEEAVAACRERLEKDGVIPGGVYLSPAIDQVTLLNPTNGFLLCASEQGEASYIELLNRHGRDDYFRADMITE